jgi:hypothetical protein
MPFRLLSGLRGDCPRGWLRQRHIHCWDWGGGHGREGEQINGSWQFFLGIARSFIFANAFSAS